MFSSSHLFFCTNVSGRRRHQGTGQTVRFYFFPCGVKRDALPGLGEGLPLEALLDGGGDGGAPVIRILVGELVLLHEHVDGLAHLHAVTSANGLRVDRDHNLLVRHGLVDGLGSVGVQLGQLCANGLAVTLEDALRQPPPVVLELGGLARGLLEGGEVDDEMPVGAQLVLDLLLLVVHCKQQRRRKGGSGK